MAKRRTLPDYSNPPLNEVVLSVQFNPVPGYQQIQSYEVWSLFKKRFPLVRDMQPIAPSFETFGLPQPQQLNIDLVTGPSHDRFWFMSEGEEEIIQFQNDRLIHNWRKVGEKTNEYPRYEKMISSFSTELRKLEVFFKKKYKQGIEINQCELSYINHIYTSEDTPSSDKYNSFKFLSFEDPAPEDIFISFREILRGKDNDPIGRLICEARSAIDSAGRRIIQFTLTVRGAPNDSNLNSALEFLDRARTKIVQSFTKYTSDAAHNRWGRIN